MFKCNIYTSSVCKLILAVAHIHLGCIHTCISLIINDRVIHDLASVMLVLFPSSNHPHIIITVVVVLCVPTYD